MEPRSGASRRGQISSRLPHATSPPALGRRHTLPAPRYGTGLTRLIFQSRSTGRGKWRRSEEHTSELQSLRHIVCRLLLEKKKNKRTETPRRHTTTNQTTEQRTK